MNVTGLWLTKTCYLTGVKRILFIKNAENMLCLPFVRPNSVHLVSFFLFTNLSKTVNNKCCLLCTLF